jgi:predicted PurR-regulated permease PerM
MPEEEEQQQPVAPEPVRIETGEVEKTAGFGVLGRPLARSPFVLGFLAALGALTAYHGVAALRGALNVIILVFIALFLAIGLNPAVVRLQRWKVPRGLAVAIVVLGVVIFFCGGIVALVPPIVGQADAFMDKLPGYLDELNRNATLRDLDERYHVIERLKSAVTPASLALAAGGLLGGIGLVFGTIFNVLTVVILTIYFLAAFDRLKRGAYRLVPASRRERVQALGDDVLTKIGGYITGALLISVIAGVTTAAFLLIIGVPYAIALAVIVALFDLVPQIGAMLGAVSVSIVGFAVSVPVGIACVVFFILYQQLENWLIYPRIMSRTVRVTDLAAIIAALLGAALLGVVGALIAIPAVAALQLVVREVFIPRQETR